MHLFISVLLLFNLLLADAQVQEIKTHNFESFEKEVLQNSNNEDLLVINFWATWCKPCIQELPHFEKINEEFHNQNVRVILVSLDFQNQYDSRLVPFVKDNKLASELIWLNDTKYNTWIDKVSPQWSGAIPATVFRKGGKNLKFFEKELTEEELRTTINEII